jgi:hypothetical protein
MAGPTLYSYLVDAPVAIFASDVAGEEPALAAQGLMLSLLGTADAATLRRWFARLAKGGEVVDDLQERPWGACDGQVIDRYGLHWLIGFEDDASAPNRSGIPVARQYHFLRGSLKLNRPTSNDPFCSGTAFPAFGV